jgi:tRNA(Ile)-lysidine synthase
MNNQWAYEINKLIIDRNLIHPKTNILIAASGGQDSMLLYSLFYRLHIRWQWRLGTIHCDHQWTSASIEHAKSIYKLTYSTGSPLYLAIPVAKVRSEEKARIWRYSLIYQVAASHKYSSIVIGHTSSDRAETLLLNCFRGTSFDGMKSLQWKRTINYKFIVLFEDQLKLSYYFITYIYRRWFYQKLKIDVEIRSLELVRPLLKVTRTEVRQQILTWQIPVSFDQSNEGIKIRRNRIRHQLIPYLKKYFNPRVEHVLNGLAETTNYDLIYLNNIVKSLSNKIIQINTEYSMSLELSIVNSMPINMQRRVLKHFLNCYTEAYFSFEQIEYIRLNINTSAKTDIRLFKKQSDYSKKILSLPDKIQVEIQNHQLIISKRL